MIPVSSPPPPPNYQTDVLTPGQVFLAACPNPNRTHWNQHRYWSKVHQYLYSQLNGICSYSASVTAMAGSANVETTSIDHFVPKSDPPYNQAYEWDNFRLCRARLNNRKGNFRDVLDPYNIASNWFRLDFTTFALSPDPVRCPTNKQGEVVSTITRLKLNTDDDYVNERTRVAYRYADGTLDLDSLNIFYPFIGRQMVIQDFNANFLDDFKRLLANPALRNAFVANGILDG